MSNLKRPTVVEIPFVDDDVMVNGSSKSSDNDSPRQKRTISERKGANLRLIIDGDESDVEMEKRDKPGPLISDLYNQLEVAPTIGLRRNSFSMPALNENDLDALRALHMSAIDNGESEDVEQSKESLNEITVSVRGYIKAFLGRFGKIFESFFEAFGHQNFLVIFFKINFLEIDKKN